jgi:hypothetical protein
MSRMKMEHAHFVLYILSVKLNNDKVKHRCKVIE